VLARPIVCANCLSLSFGGDNTWLLCVPTSRLFARRVGSTKVEGAEGAGCRFASRRRHQAMQRAHKGLPAMLLGLTWSCVCAGA